jgi:membrane-associated protein
MEHIHFLINYILHLNENLAVFVAAYGAWVYALLFLIIFCEMGIVFAAIMPGDSLLFAAGSIAATGAFNVYFLMVLLIVAAFSGYVLNYWIGNKLGHVLFRDENSKIFKKAYLERTHVFYEKHGGKTILIACFIPIIRTFAPFVAGMSKMNHSKFITFNFIGACVWVILLVYGSYLFGNIPFVKRNFSFVIIVIIIISVLPPFIEYARHKLS